MKIYLASEADSRQQASLKKAGYKHRLLSYFYLRKKKPNVIRDMVETGSVTNQKPQKPRDKKNVDDE